MQYFSNILKTNMRVQCFSSLSSVLKFVEGIVPEFLHRYTSALTLFAYVTFICWKYRIIEITLWSKTKTLINNPNLRTFKVEISKIIFHWIKIYNSEIIVLPSSEPRLDTSIGVTFFVYIFKQNYLPGTLISLLC